MSALDIPAGSTTEKTLIRSLAEYFTTRGLSIKVIPVEVVEWSEVECWVNDSSCTAQPPVESAEISGMLGKDIVVSSTTRDPDNIWVEYWLGVEKRAPAIVFYDEYRNVSKRRIVVNELPSYSLKTRMRARTPAVHVPQTTLANLEKSGKVDISVKTLKKVSQGYTIEAYVGSGEPRVLIATHHDRWLAGFRDNGVGVLIVMKIAELLGRSNVPAKIVSFTAEEFGDPSESSFYWAYGSRAYVEQVIAEDIDLAIVIDTAHIEPVEVDAAGVGGLERALSLIRTRKAFVGVGYTDAVSLVSRGVPSLVLHNLAETKPVYHTDVDRYPGKSVEATVMKIARSIVNVVREFEEGDSRQFHRMYVEEVGRTLPSELGSYLKFTPDYVRLSKCLVEHYTALVIEGTYRDYNTEIKLLTYSDMLRGVEAGAKYTMLYEDLEIRSSDSDFVRKLARAKLEEVILCYKK
ncbi:MAG: M28 family peptidase [Sulfolobales archaeon]|nr:M28 family peptidase [Sulfolobales archaeon]MCX8208121.1 M28 family peptidase [Sulfolobales archaeon]MDW8010816.1 M28 family peptidase [Sulfolobales archaeon]